MTFSMIPSRQKNMKQCTVQNGTFVPHGTAHSASIHCVEFLLSAVAVADNVVGMLEIREKSPR
jgi:hypothetical protein